MPWTKLQNYDDTSPHFLQHYWQWTGSGEINSITSQINSQLSTTKENIIHTTISGSLPTTISSDIFDIYYKSSGKVGHTFVNINFENITYLGNNIFSHFNSNRGQALWNITNLTSSNLTHIGIDSLRNCKYLNTIELSSISHIGLRAFAHTGNKNKVYILKELTYYGGSCFQDVDNITKCILKKNSFLYKKKNIITGHNDIDNFYNSNNTDGWNIINEILIDNSNNNIIGEDIVNLNPINFTIHLAEPTSVSKFSVTISSPSAANITTSRTDSETFTGTITANEVLERDCIVSIIVDGTPINTYTINILTLPELTSITIIDIISPSIYSDFEVEYSVPLPIDYNVSALIEPSYVASLNGSITNEDRKTWTGQIERTLGINSLNNILTITANGISGQTTFDVLEEDVVLNSTYHITDSGKKILYTPFSRSAEDNQGKIEVFDPSGNIEHTLTDDVVGSVYVNQEGNLIVIGLPKDDGKVKSYLFEDGSWNEYYNGNNEYPNGTNLGELVHLTGNNELMVVNNTTASNYEVDIYKESVARYATYFETIGDAITYPDNSLNFEIRLTTNDVLLADISANAANLFSIDPSYVGYIDANSLSLSNYGFTLHGTFTVSGEYNEPNVKLFYNDFSSNAISLDSVQDLSINDFYFDSSFVTYLNHTTNKITLNLNRGDITNADVSNSLTLDPSNCGSITNVSNDGLNSSIKKITFEPAYQFENSNCSLTFDYNQGLLDASQTILFSVNNYVPQIANITNDNSFNYIDTSGTILLEFDRNLLRDLTLNDLSYNETKLDLQLEKLSDSSYNLIVDPSGEYAETQVITVKDLLGTDLSNISLEIDTIIPTFSEITMAPGAFNYEVSGGILDVQFNKTLLDREQLVLTSSSDISFTFLRQLDNNASSGTNVELSGIEPSLNNFTYTIEGDASENIIKAALQKWDNIIVRHPIDVSNNADGGTTKIHITFSVSEMEAGTLGYAYVDYVYQDDLNHNGIIDYSDNIYTSSGFIALSQASYNSMISETRTDGNTTLYYVLMHEIGHIIGIGPYFGHNNSPRVAYQEQGSDVTKYYYTGANALAKYKMYMDDVSLVGIPIEDDGGAGTVNVHPEEHRIEGKTRHIGGHPHEGLDEELMTGWTESGSTIMPLSAVSIGFLEDMGYDVSYAFADIYRNMDYNGNTVLPSLKMGITMDTTLPVFPTYSVVQYEVKSNDYGLKSIQDISFNYRGNYDVSNIDIEVNTIIPDVASIEIENILYTDTSGIVTITFNDHDGNYFYGKDASMNIYLDPSSNGNITVNMDTIPDSNVWTGVITSISGEFYPDAKLYLQHSGMDGLINVDALGVYRLDTTERGLYITLPEMEPRTTTTPHSQTINYLTYDDTTNKLDTDVSFTFNIDVSNNLEQFPYTDICDNFISIRSETLEPGDVVLDKGIGFTGRFWHGILTISGEVQGTFDISYNETLNPLRHDGVVEYRRDKLTVNVNTKLPDISNVIVPVKLTYLDISGDIEIEFNKDILPGDEDNIQIEYSLEDTNEYQFLNKYGDNNVVSDANSKYVFNSVSYDANKKIALGIGTYTLNVSSIHPIFLDDNDLHNISISGINTSNGSYGTGYHGIVTINVTGDFGTASYICSSHGYMGGQNRLVYKDVEVSPLAQNSATHWKYTLYLPQEINTSLNVTIKYRDETSVPYNIPIYGIVPDVSSVTLSEPSLTFEDPSCVITIDFNTGLQHVTNIYDLISLEPSEHLFIKDQSITGEPFNMQWTGILDISNNVENEFEYSDAKVSVNGIQSAEFGQGVSGEVLFNIDTILPDISNVIISKMGYSNKTSNFTITFTKDDLNGVDISNSLSVPSEFNFTITNVGLISGNTLTGDIRTNDSGIEADVSFIIDYTFNYRNDTLQKQIYRATDFEVDTRERGIKTLSLTNDTDITNNGNSYLFTYLDNIGNLTLEFFTNDLSGIDVSSDMSFNPTINYSLSDNVINDTSLNAIITVDMSQNAGPITFTYSDSEDRTSFQNNIFIDTRPRYITNITFSTTELTYLDKQGTLTITFNHNIFEDVDVITNLLNYPTSDLSLNNATITGSIWYCNLLSISELDGSFDVSLVYNGETYSLSTSIILDTIIPRIDTPDETDIGNKNITYKNRSTLVKITFTNDIESSSEITDTLKLEGVSDSSYSFVGNLDSTSKIEWNGQLTIDDWDISLSDVIIYSTYEGGTIINNDKLKIDINTKRPEITNSNISIDKDKFTYLEPSGTLSITFGGESVLDTSINSFIYSGSAITVGSMSRTGDTWTGNISINQYDISENQVVNITDYYGQNASIMIPFMTILPRVDTISNVTNEYNYLELGSSREIEFSFSSEVLETNIATFANNSISINNNDCSLNSFSRLTDNSIKANFVVNKETEIDDLKIKFDYYSEYYDVSINQEFVLMNVDTRIPNIIEDTDISNTNLTYDASSTQLDVYFDASLLDENASLILDASLVTSFSDPSINISQFEELSKTHYRANITTEYGIDKLNGNSVTVNYMDTSATLTFNVDTILRPYSNICFPRGEKVLTDNGYKTIEQIDIKLDTIRGEKIEELTQTQTQEKELVLIKCGALMENMPNKDTLITNNHKVLYKGKLVEAYKLVTLVESGVELVDYNGETLYNILLEGENEGKMIVNGMIVETLSHTNNIARLYKKIRKYGTTEYKKKRMIELFNQQKKK